ncbi:MAG: GGDEF domain-containing protein [Proteobacteria bacterium]|nr:GGDEF domain-containing protein [Pseudomonadota bacterium]
MSNKENPTNMDKDLLLFQNVEMVELLNLYRRIIRFITEWDITRLKEQLLDEILNTTFGSGVLLYIYNEDDDTLHLDMYRGTVDLNRFKNAIKREEIDEAHLDFYINPNEINMPLRYNEKFYGLVKITEPVMKEGFTEKEFNKSYYIGEFIPLALENAKKIEILQRCSIKDERNNAYFWDIFKDFVKKEIYKSLRYDRKLSVIGILIENLEELKKRHKEDDIILTLKEILDNIHSVIRDSDWLVEKEKNYFLIFLTETDYFGALMAIRRIRQALVGKGILKTARDIDEIKLNISAVGLPIHGNTLEELLKALEEKIDQNRKSLYFKLDFNKQNLEQLISEIINFKEKNNTKFFCWYKKDKEVFPQIVSLLLNDIKINSKRRGIFYASIYDKERAILVQDKKSFIDAGTKVYFFWEDKGSFVDIPGVVNVVMEKKGYETIKFLFFLNEHYAYGVIEVGEYVFETSDQLMVEGMINKIQSEYYLQWQL